MSAIKSGYWGRESVKSSSSRCMRVQRKREQQMHRLARRERREVWRRASRVAAAVLESPLRKGS